MRRNAEERREADIRRSRETLNKSTKPGEKKGTTATKTKGANKKKTVPKSAEEEDTSLSGSSEEETTKKTTQKKATPKKATPKKATPKKKTASKPAGEIETTTLPLEDDQEAQEGVTIKKHSYDKKTGLYTVWVAWKKSKKAEWQFLHDMWVDYPEEVKTYWD